MLVAYENVQNPPEAWNSVLQWHAHDTHILFMCRQPGDIQKLDLGTDVPHLAMPRSLNEGTEFPQVLDRLLQSLPLVRIDDTARARLYKLTGGLPLAVQLVVRQLGRDGDSTVSKVLDTFEGSGDLGKRIYTGCIARLTPLHSRCCVAWRTSRPTTCLRPC